MSGAPWQRTAVDISRSVRAGEVRAVDVLETYLERILATEGALNAFIRVDEDGARRQAEAVDSARAAGADLGLLAGVPVAIKDQIVTKGLETTAGSRMLAGFVPPYDATAVERLRAAGAVIVGKTNQDEFAMGSSNESSAYGVCRNPWALDRVPGGSSGGSAVAVAAGQAPLALGTDTGGSVRQPAALTGVVGLKPTYGRVSRYGAIAFASSLDQIGPLGRTVADTATALQVIAGHDPRDSTSYAGAALPYAQQLSPPSSVDLRGLRVGMPDQYFADGLEPGVRACVQAGIDRLADAGATIHAVTLPHAHLAVATYYLIATAEASSNLSRYDGVRYGYRAAGFDGIDDLIRRSRGEGFGAEVKRRILLGTFALSAGYYDAYYGKAQRVRTLIRRDFETAFADVDVIASPTSPTMAFEVGAVCDDPLQMYLMDIYTLSANLAGIPAISVPCGQLGGLPVGLQLQGRPFDELTLLRAALAHEERYSAAQEWPPELESSAAPRSEA